MIYGNEANIIAEEEEIIPNIECAEELPIIVQDVNGGSSETPETIKQKYESNLNTNAFTDALKEKLDEQKYLYSHLFRIL